jgi:hypothetical protein
MNKKSKQELIIFLFTFFIELFMGIYWGYFKGIILNDAFSRTANSFYVLFVDPERFASIGLVWNPLPSALQLPFIFFAKFWRPIASAGISASIVTSFFAAASAVLLYKTFKEFNINPFFSILLICFYVLNPFIFFYGFNGMSEVIFFYFIIYVCTSLTIWIDKGTPDYIVKIAFALSLAFFCRYEAVPFAFAVGLGIAINMLKNKNQKEYLPNNDLKETYYYAESTFVILYTPFLYSILLWIFFNWIISGNPLYFLNSAYSNSAQSEYAAKSDTLLLTIKYVFTKSAPFIPLFLGIFLVRLLDKRLFKNDFMILFSLVFAMIAFHFLMLFKGSSYGWLRFFSYSLPICIAWLPYELTKIKKQNKTIAYIIIIISLICSSLLATKFLSDPKLSPEENYGIISNSSKKVAAYINNNLLDDDNIILLDSFLTSVIILNIDDIDSLILNSSLEFDIAMKNPYLYDVTYIIVPNLDGIGNLDAINLEYPNLYSNEEEWCTEIEEFDGYKLFKVIY